MRYLILHIFFLVSLLIIGCNNNLDKSELSEMKTVDYVDIERFMGDWYVIANIPTFIEKGATNAIESYKLGDKGVIETTFTFYQDSPDGEKKVYRPKGFIYNTETNAEWRMQFIWPFKMPFLIIDLDDNYQFTVIGYPSRKYVWIMAREPKLSDEVYEGILSNLAEVGYDISQINKILQQWN